MKKSTDTWVVVADSSGARIFRFAEKNEAWTLVQHIKGDGTGHPPETRDFGKKASEHKGALHAHGEGDPKETQERRFSHELAHVLERGLSDSAFGHLALVAPPKLLGMLRENLSRGLQECIVAEMHKDYVHASAKEIQEHLLKELPV